MSTQENVKRFVYGRIQSLSASLDFGMTKAQLANLRRGVGRRPGEIPELWGMMLQNWPEELMSQNGEPTYAEWAAYMALTLFALHQQGHGTVSMNASGVENRLGRAVRRLVHDEDEEERISQKLAISAASDDMEELSYRLKTLIRFLSNADIKLDYADLAGDLYMFQFENRADEVRLKWGQDFYRDNRNDEDRKDDIDEK